MDRAGAPRDVREDIERPESEAGRFKAGERLDKAEDYRPESAHMTEYRQMMGEAFRAEAAGDLKTADKLRRESRELLVNRADIGELRSVIHQRSDKGGVFEDWARKNVFKSGSWERSSINTADNLDIDEAAAEKGVLLNTERTIPDAVNLTGSTDKDGNPVVRFWDTKAYSEGSRIDPYQAERYDQFTGRTVEATDRKSGKTRKWFVEGTNYLFLDKATAEANAAEMRHNGVDAWYLDEAGSVRSLHEASDDGSKK